MTCAPAEARPAFRLGVWERNGREYSEDGADDHTSGRGSKVFEFFEGGAAQSGKPEGESSISLRDGRSDQLRIFSNTLRMNPLCILDTAVRSRPELAA